MTLLNVQNQAQIVKSASSTKVHNHNLKRLKLVQFVRMDFRVMVRLSSIVSRRMQNPHVMVNSQAAKNAEMLAQKKIQMTTNVINALRKTVKVTHTSNGWNNASEKIVEKKNGYTIITAMVNTRVILSLITVNFVPLILIELSRKIDLSVSNADKDLILISKVKTSIWSVNLILNHQ